MFTSILGRADVVQAQAAAALRGNTGCTTPDCLNRADKIKSMGTAGSLFGPIAYDVFYNPAAFQSAFYMSLVLFILFLTLVFIHFTMFPVFSFTAGDLGFIPIPSVSDQQIAFQYSPPAYDMAAPFVNMPACSYTLGADVFLSGTFMLTQVPRVILYRGPTPIILMTGNTVDAMPDTYAGSDILVWLDPVMNDLYVSANTTNGLITTKPVENVPVKNVFRLAVVFTPNFLEVYINGKLEQSVAIDNPIVSPEGPVPNLYGSINAIQNNVMIGNLTMWPRVLTVNEIQANEGAPKKTNAFFPLR